MNSVAAKALEKFDFPEDANARTSEPALRQAIYRAFNGVDFYTQHPISVDEMVIDHIIPRAKGAQIMCSIMCLQLQELMLRKAIKLIACLWINGYQPLEQYTLAEY